MLTMDFGSTGGAWGNPLEKNTCLLNAARAGIQLAVGLRLEDDVWVQILRAMRKPPPAPMGMLDPLVFVDENVSRELHGAVAALCELCRVRLRFIYITDKGVAEDQGTFGPPGCVTVTLALRSYHWTLVVTPSAAGAAHRLSDQALALELQKQEEEDRALARKLQEREDRDMALALARQLQADLALAEEQEQQQQREDQALAWQLQGVAY
jgi:hypothetical protein